jgi:hypothetical protein
MVTSTPEENVFVLSAPQLLPLQTPHATLDWRFVN